MRTVALTLLLCALGCRALPTAANFEYLGEDGAVGADAEVLADAAQDGDETLADASESDSTDATAGDVGPDAAGDEADAEFDADVAVDAVIDLCAGKNCDDSNTCTTDSCDASGACVHTVTASCNDGNPCTADACTAAGCQHTNTMATCDDGNACTTGDVCVLGKCAGTLPICGNGSCDCGESPSTCWQDCPPPMIALAAGTFTMGSPTGTGNPYAEPQHQVTLSAFQIDETEVTVAQYTVFYNQLSSGEKCVNQNIGSFACGTPDMNVHCNWGIVGREQHPVNCVDWHQAGAYCAWAHPGGRLPTEAEWEYAARDGGKVQDYPWGSPAPTCSLANYSGCNASSTAAVCSTPSGNSGGGACDLAGNVGEWCSDWYGGYTSGTQTNPTGASSGTGRVFRGGAWNTLIAPATVRSVLTPYSREAYLGIRCARTL